MQISKTSLTHEIKSHLKQCNIIVSKIERQTNETYDNKTHFEQLKKRRANEKYNVKKTFRLMMTRNAKKIREMFRNFCFD
jgi:hypothetical protein